MAIGGFGFPGQEEEERRRLAALLAQLSIKGDFQGPQPQSNAVVKAGQLPFETSLTGTHDLTGPHPTWSQMRSGDSQEAQARSQRMRDTLTAKGDNTPPTPPENASWQAMLRALLEAQDRGQQFTGRTQEFLQEHRELEAPAPEMAERPNPQGAERLATVPSPFQGQQVPPEAMGAMQAQAAVQQQLPQSPMPPQQLPQSQQQAIQAQPKAQMPGNSLQGHIGDRGDALRMLRERAMPQPSAQITPASANMQAPQPAAAQNQPPAPQVSQNQTQSNGNGGLLAGLAKFRDSDFGQTLGALMAGMGQGTDINDSLAKGTQMAWQTRQASSKDRKAQALLEKKRQAAIKYGLDPNLADALDNDGLDSVLAKQFELINKGQDPIEVNEGSALTDKAGNELYKNPKREKPDLVTLVPPSGSGGKARSVNISTEGGLALAEGLLSKGWVEAPKAATSLTNALGGEAPADATLRTELSKSEAERWSKIQQAGIVAGGMQQDMEILGELLNTAPQGPLTGRLAEMFPGFSAAGDAAESFMKRIAPSLRTPGSGSTSDIEYDGFLKSMPRLRNTPDGNRIIGETLKAKAAIDIARSQAITDYQNGEITASEARATLAKFNKQSIMTPQVKQLLEGLSGSATEGVTQGGVKFKVIE